MKNDNDHPIRFGCHFPRDPEPSEFVAVNLSVHDRECIGCQTHGRHIMLSFTRMGDPVVYDLFLTKSQTMNLASALLDDLANTAQ